MSNLSPNLKNHFDSEITTLATCWKLTRVDKGILGFTGHDKALVIDGITYDSIAGFTPTSIESSSSLAVDNLELAGQLYPSKITAEDLLAGKYDFAQVEIFLVNYQQPNSGKLMQKRGILGEVTLKKNLFYAEVRGLTQYLSQNICEVYMPQCRANLGDSRCGVKLSQPDFTVEATVSTATNQQSFIANTLNQQAGWFTGGYVTWQSGKNIGLKMEVKEFADGKITLVLPMPFVINQNDKFTIVAGCDKSSSTCIEKFKNIINFRCEPDLPGMDSLMTTAGTMRR